MYLWMVNSWCFSSPPSDSRCHKCGSSWGFWILTPIHWQWRLTNNINIWYKNISWERESLFWSNLCIYLLFSSDNSTEVSSSDNKTTRNQRTFQVNTQYSVSVFYSLFSKKLSCNVVALCKLIKTFYIYYSIDCYLVWLSWHCTDIITMELASKRAAPTITLFTQEKVWPGNKTLNMTECRLLLLPSICYRISIFFVAVVVN